MSQQQGAASLSTLSKDVAKAIAKLIALVVATTEPDVEMFIEKRRILVHRSVLRLASQPLDLMFKQYDSRPYLVLSNKEHKYDEFRNLVRFIYSLQWSKDFGWSSFNLVIEYGIHWSLCAARELVQSKVQSSMSHFSQTNHFSERVSRAAWDFLVEYNYVLRRRLVLRLKLVSLAKTFRANLEAMNNLRNSLDDQEPTANEEDFETVS